MASYLWLLAIVEHTVNESFLYNKILAFLEMFSFYTFQIKCKWLPHILLPTQCIFINSSNFLKMTVAAALRGKILIKISFAYSSNFANVQL